MVLPKKGCILLWVKLSGFIGVPVNDIPWNPPPSGSLLLSIKLLFVLLFKLSILSKVISCKLLFELNSIGKFLSW